MNGFDSDCYTDSYYCAQRFDTSLVGLELDSRSQGCKKANIFLTIISQSVQLIWIQFVMLLRLVGVMDLILILLHPLNIPLLYDFVKKVNIGLYVLRHLQTNFFQTWHDDRDH